jgi:hypothetical protein
MRKLETRSGGGANSWRRMAAQLLAALEAHCQTGGAPRVPVAGVPIWQAFAALCMRRQWHANGGQPLTLAEVQAQARLCGMVFAPHHVDLIFALDRAWLEAMANPRPADAVPLTPDLFDAMLG